jgi:hypothetical protein
MGPVPRYWAVFVTVAAEQYGTNLRATVATTTPNFVRGSGVLLAVAWEWLAVPLGSSGRRWWSARSRSASQSSVSSGWRFSVDLDYVSGRTSAAK